MKMLRARKKFGRCSCDGHGCNCEVSREIQSQPMTRTDEKREWKKDISDLLKAVNDWEPSEKEIKELEQRLELAEKQFEEKERQASLNYHEWLNKGYTL